MHATRDIDEKPYVEYLDGEARVKVSPRLEHGIVQNTLGAILHRCAGDRGAVACELHVYPGRLDGSQTIFVPDIAFVYWETVQRLPTGETQPATPDVAIEVRSPSNGRWTEKKIARYLAAGTLLALDVDPKALTIVAHDAQGSQTFGSVERFERASVPWLAFEVSEAFADLERLPGRGND